MGGFLLFLKRNITVVLLVSGIGIMVFVAKGFLSAFLLISTASALLYGWYRLFG
jgi:hypothetical protein